MPRTPHRRPRANGSTPPRALARIAAMSAGSAAPLVGILMGSKSDWETMAHAAKALDALGIAYEVNVMSAHRTPALVDEYVTSAEGRGLEVIIAGAGGAAHLAGVCAARTLLPVLGVPMQSKALNGMDSLLSTVQMQAGLPAGRFGIGQGGATNAGRHPGRHAAHRAGRRHQCGPARGGHPGRQASSDPRRAPQVSRQPDPGAA